jgi:hypothetical protein
MISRSPPSVFPQEAAKSRAHHRGLNCRFARARVLGKATAGDHAITTRPDHLDRLPNSAPQMANHVGSQSTAFGTKRPGQPKGDPVDSKCRTLTNLPMCVVAFGLGSRERGDARAYKTAIVNTTYQRLSCSTFTLVTAVSADNERSRKVSKNAQFRAFKAATRVRIPLEIQDQTSADQA